MWRDRVGKLVVVVEDEFLIASLVEDLLIEAGFDPRLASSGTEAQAVLDAVAGNAAALITDIHLESALTGWDVAEHARGLRPGLPVVYMTGFSTESWASRGVTDSVVLAKPFDPAQLISVVNALIEAAH